MDTDDTTIRYQPQVEKVEDLIGIAMHAAKAGDQVKVLQKAFLTSYENNHRYLFEGVLSQFPIPDLQALNEVLIIIREGRCLMYRQYPLMVEIRSKTSIAAGSAVFEDQILDMRAVKFKDGTTELEVRDGDKVVWLFRVGWSFGLYFDLSGKLKSSEVERELGRCYRQMHFHSLYWFLSSEENVDRLFDRGWFPFVQILGEKFNRLRFTIDDTKGLEIVEDSLVSYFAKNKISEISNRWWANEIFKQRRSFLMAGVNAYIAGGTDDIINAINTLTPQIEGIMRFDYHRVVRTRPSTRELKEHMKTRAIESFPDPDSLGFPEYFSKYVERVFFRDFDVEQGDVRISRHSVGHGVANTKDFSKVRALQLVLVLDQIYFYLRGGERLVSDEEKGSG